MKKIHADFNDIAADGTLPLTSAGSVASLARFKTQPEDGEEVWFTDGESQAKGQLFRRPDGTWFGRSDWRFVSRAEPTADED